MNSLSLVPIELIQSRRGLTICKSHLDDLLNLLYLLIVRTGVLLGPLSGCRVESVNVSLEHLCDHVVLRRVYLAYLAREST